MGFTCCLNLVFIWKSSRRDVKRECKTAPESAFCLDFCWLHFSRNDFKKSEIQNCAFGCVQGCQSDFFLWFFRRLRREFSWNHIKCKNNNQTCLFQCINICRVPRKVFEHQPAASCSNSFLGTRQMLMHEKACMIPIFANKEVISVWISEVRKLNCKRNLWKQRKSSKSCYFQYSETTLLISFTSEYITFGNICMLFHQYFSVFH